ncbi:MAG TPA: lysylphosphatidylglycerol synthase transmembrane domain-containing protein [Solirubrobacteraceae bacterium]|nr:lysylphosphatidylglycerol synthase transmembrane domain-containing protein [Solirubrobacteraceae bacterium]
MSTADSSARERAVADQEDKIAAADRAVSNGNAVDHEDVSLEAGIAPEEGSGDEQMPRVPVTRRSAIAFGVFVLSAVAFLYFVLPKLTGFSSTAHRIESGDTWWIAIGVLLEICSFAGYVVLFRAVFVRDPSPIGWSESYQITMAGLAATRLFAAAGAGGIALTAWALRRSGMEPRLVACRMVAFMVLLYVVYAGAVLLDGIGMGTGLLPGEGSFALTIVPAVVAALLFALAGAMALLPGDIERRLARWAAGSGRLEHWLASAVTVPALAASGVRTAIELVRKRDPGLLGAPAWWGFDICVLWACFHAFGSAPPFTVILMAYFLGMVGNLLPLPGGLGGVEGGMIGAFAAFGVNLDQAVLAVLAYRAISFWLPTVPGAIAYFQLRRTVARWRSEQAAPKSATAKPIETAGPLHA